jgi:hypothetical protein
MADGRVQNSAWNLALVCDLIAKGFRVSIVPSTQAEA